MQESLEFPFARAHTAEHAFVGALQNLAGQTLSVVKVEHREKNNTAFIKTVPKMDLELILQLKKCKSTYKNRKKCHVVYFFITR